MIIIAACLMLTTLMGLPHGRASADVESRILSAISWLKGQEVSSPYLKGFARGTDAATNRTIFVEDQALIALAISDYHSTHNDDRYDDLLKIAANFIMSAQTSNEDFYEYYDLASQQWFHAGGLYPWDAWAIAGLAAAAYKISSKNPKELPFWVSIETKLKLSVKAILSNQRDDGAWLFSKYGTGVREAGTRENAILLVGMQYLALFEYQWGTKKEADFYATLSGHAASWLFSMQVTDPTLPTFGGFPHSDRNSTQLSEENGAVLLGVDTYYSIIGVLTAKPSPTIWDARRVMTDWVAGFVRKMRDTHGGPYYGRSSTGAVEYPKTTRSAAWILQALSDIWINIGGPDYYDDAQKPYLWIVGENELGADLQAATNMAGGSGGFYNAIMGRVLDETSRTDIVASTLYAFVRAAFILIPEFPEGAAANLLLVVLCAVLAIKQLKVRKWFR